MPNRRTELLEHVLDLVWSLWAELGVSGWQRRHSAHAVDPEALIVFTAALGDADPRLRDESTDWCLRYGRWVAGARLRNLVELEPEPVRAAFGEYAATVAAHSRLRWPLATRPRPYEPTGRSRVEDFSRPSLIALRLRALFGVGARAEILRALIARPGEAPTASELAEAVNYTKRNVAEELDALRMAGILVVEPVRNLLRFRVAKPKELLGLAGKRPDAFFPWRHLFRILTAALDFTSRESTLDPRVREVELHRMLRDIEPDLRKARVSFDNAESTDDALWPVFERWAAGFAERLASGDINALRPLKSRAAS